MIADSREIERQLAELSSLYRTLPIAVVFLDPELQITRCSDAFAALFEVPAAPRSGRPLREVMPALGERLEPLCRNVLREGTSIVEEEIEDLSSRSTHTPHVWLASCHRVADDAGAVQGVSLTLQDVAATRRNEQSIRDMAIGVSTAGGAGFFPALAAHIASTLEADVVLIARLARYPGRRVLTIAAMIDGQPGEAAESHLEGSPWEEALRTDLWLSTEPTQAYGALHPQLQDVTIESGLILPLRDSSSTPRGFLAVLSRRPFKNIDAAALTLKVYGARAASELDRKRSEDENLSLVSELSISVRELSMLHVVTRILQQDELVPISDWLTEVADTVRRLWPRQETVAVRASLGSFQTNVSYPDDIEWTHRAAFSLADGRTGGVDIAYLDGVRDRASLHRPAFLDSIAEMLKTAIDRRLILVALRQSEQRYRSVVENQSDLVCRFLPDTTLTFVNDAYCRFFKRTREELIGTRFIELIPPKGRDVTLTHIAELSKGAPPHVYEHAVLMPDGRIGRHQWINHAIASHDGRIDELQGIGRDITARWLVEEALRVKEASLREAYQRIRSLAQRLILAQEAERTEIARDLHDDVGQQLAALSIGLSIVETRLTDRPDLGSGVAGLRQIANGLADKVRNTSHALHPGVLKHAGLSAALASHCETVESQHAIGVAFEPEGPVDDVADEVGLCIYRVVQQALRNVVMHADASHAIVRLMREERQVVLLVADDGRGFDPTEAHAQGIGLLSMEERVRLVNGSFSVDSTPGGGSLLRIEIPTPPAGSRASADGS